MPVLPSIQIAYQSKKHSGLICFRFSSLNIPKTMQFRGDDLEIFPPACRVISFLKFEDKDLSKLKEPYEVYRKTGNVVYIKGQGIKTELFALAYPDGSLQNRDGENIGTWKVEDGQWYCTLTSKE